MQGKQYAVTLQTPGGPFRGKLFLLVQNQIARGEFSWENMRVPVPRVPVREGEIAFEGMLAFPPVPYTVRFRLGPGENTLEGSCKNAIRHISGLWPGASGTEASIQPVKPDGRSQAKKMPDWLPAAGGLFPEFLQLRDGIPPDRISAGAEASQRTPERIVLKLPAGPFFCKTAPQGTGNHPVPAGAFRTVFTAHSDGRIPKRMGFPFFKNFHHLGTSFFSLSVFQAPHGVLPAEDSMGTAYWMRGKSQIRTKQAEAVCLF